jgi:kynurenine formamidase
MESYEKIAIHTKMLEATLWFFEKVNTFPRNRVLFWVSKLKIAHWDACVI